MMQRPGILFLRSTGSTNNEMWKRLDAKLSPDEGFVIRTAFQQSGKGQGNTRWESEAGKNLLFSILLKPTFLAPSNQFMLNKAIALALRDALAALSPGTPFAIKWPNDIVSSGKKIAGTLIENRIMGKVMEASVAGIGININQKTFPPALPRAGSLATLSGKEYNLDACLEQARSSIGYQVNRLREGHIEATNKDYLQHLSGYNETVRFEKDGVPMNGRIAGVNNYGKLLVDDLAGEIREYGIKEIRQVY